MTLRPGRRVFLKTMGSGAAALAGARLLGARGPYEPDWAWLEKHPAPAWFDDAKFGIYFHWGIYSVPAFDNEWYSRNLYIEGTRANRFHKLVYGPPSKFGYKDFIPMFHAEKFDPGEWAALFRKAGAKFAGPVTEHADGFSMWDSKVNPWNAARLGPGRDVVGEMARAVRDEGLKFIATFHHQWLWGWYPTTDPGLDTSKYAGLYGPPAPGSPFDYRHPTPPAPAAFQEEWEAKVREVIDRYRPDLIYFDSRLDVIDAGRRAALLAYYYNRAGEWGKETGVTYKDKDLPAGAGILDIERGRLAGLAPFKWLTDDSIDWNSWCYVQNPHYKSAGRLLGELVDIVSKNGNLLLDVNPTAEGVMPEPAVERLLEIGKWLGVNGEAIYGTRPWKIFGEGPTQIKAGMFGEAGTPDFTAQDIRFTARAKALYAIALGRPEERQVIVGSLQSGRGLVAPGEIANVALLGCEARLEWEQTAEGLRIGLRPKTPPGSPPRSRFC